MEVKKFSREQIEKIIKEEDRKESEEKLELYYDGDLMNKEFPEPEWIIKNQIPKGEIGIIAGKRGERKTFFALYQAICISAGINCIEDKVIKKHKVIYVSEEDSIVALNPRIQALKKGLGIQEENLEIVYLILNNLKLDDEESERTKYFQEILSELKPDVIIIDTLQRCVSFDVDIDNRAISEFFTNIIQPMKKEYGGTWLFIHHLRKGIGGGKPPEDLMDEIRGGSEIVNYPRFILICQVPKQSKELMILTPAKMSYAELSDPKVISFTNSEEDKSIIVNYEGLPKDVLKTEIKCAEAIENYLFSNQIMRFKTKDLKDNTEAIGYKKSMISAGLKLLVEREIVQRIKQGFYVVKGDGNQAKL